MATTLYTADEPLTASHVIATSTCVLHGILVSSFTATATMQLFDDVTTTSPANPVTGLWTLSASNIAPFFIPFDIVLSHGLTIIIAVAAMSVTPIGRFSG